MKISTEMLLITFLSHPELKGLNPPLLKF